MLDVDGSIIPSIDPDYTYVSKHKERFWIKGAVGNKTPHVTVLFGLMKSAVEYKKQIDELLKDWNVETVTIDKVSFFNSPYLDDPYFCIVAHLKITPELLLGHTLIQLLPHIDTFSGYKAHITLAYIKQSEKIKKEVIGFYAERLEGKSLKVKGLNYGRKE
jgi:2'-5' RNA ligase